MNKDESHSLAATRWEAIERILQDRGIARVDELADELGVSGATIRRDLAELDQRGVVRRVHGGAVNVAGRLDEPLFDDKTALRAAEKQAIAEKARGLVAPNSSIYLDGGSTALALARLLMDVTNLTVVTNSLRVATTLAAGGPHVIVVGGELRRLSQTFVGALTQPMTANLHVDRAFMGTIGLTIHEGLTTTDPDEAFTKELMMHHAEQVVLLADSSKMGKVAFARFGGVDDLDMVITDSGASAAFCHELRDHRVNVKTVEA